MSLATHVRTLGRGPGRSRSLTRDEAYDAMTAMLAPEAAPEAVGALLMLLRLKGETAEEIAGFAAAAQSPLRPMMPVDLDWPSYAAGRTRGLPWFLLSAKMIAATGRRVLLHGYNGADAPLRDHLHAVEIPLARDVSQIISALDTCGVAYAPLEVLHPALFRLLSLRDVLGLRSCINTVARMLNPGHAPASVQGVFHPSYRLLQADAARLLSWRALTVIKGGGGEFERNPAKAIAGFGLRDGMPTEATFPALHHTTLRLAEGPDTTTTLETLWRGDHSDPFAEAVVIGTAALALDTLGEKEPLMRARTLWTNRHGPRAHHVEDAA